MSGLLPDGMQLRWLGHATFDLTGPAGRKFLFDPFISGNPAFPKALEAEVRTPGAYQLILVSHAHQDHFQDVLPLVQSDPALKVVSQFEIGEWIQGQGIAEDRAIAMSTGGTVCLFDVRITMTAAVHSSSVDENGKSVALGSPVGYVLRYANGFTMYYTGDTAVTMDMQIVRDLYRPNLVVLPIGDYYTMGAEQAAYALKLLEPELAVGIHWGTWNGMPPGKPEPLEKEMARHSLKTKLIKLQPGDTLA